MALEGLPGPKGWGWIMNDAMPVSKNSFGYNNCPVCEY